MKHFKTQYPFRIARPKKPGVRETKTRARDRCREREVAVFFSWWNARLAEDLPLSRGAYKAALLSQRLRVATGGAWVSKRALHSDCCASAEAGETITWHRFLTLLREVHPGPSRSFETAQKTLRGTLISRYSETFLWFPGARVPDFHEPPCFPQPPVVG